MDKRLLYEFLYALAARDGREKCRNGMKRHEDSFE